MDEIVDFYERYIAAFNAGDREGFAEFFHLPVTVVHAPRYDDRRAGRPLALVTDPSALWAPLPDYWARSTIDSIVRLGDASPFVAHAGLEALIEKKSRERLAALGGTEPGLKAPRRRRS